MTPSEARMECRKGALDAPTAGLCPGYAQCNLIILPASDAEDFALFARLNPEACPVLEVLPAGQRLTSVMAPGADIATDLPRYRVYRDGVLDSQPTDISGLWQEDFVSFLIGCSFSFEEALINAGLPVRHIEEGRNVPMYLTNIQCRQGGRFHGPMVVSMRPFTPSQAEEARRITAQMPRVHGAPIHIGDPAAIGIRDISSPDFGDSVTVNEGEVPVFWPCGVTPQSAVMQVKPKLAITHAPGHMFICDIKNADLMEQKEGL